MVDNLSDHHRRSIRLKDYDYASKGAYFVTLCVQDHKFLLGEVVGEEMRLNGFGKIVTDCWEWLAARYSFVELDHCVVMPNHFHGILLIWDDCRGASRCARDDRHAETNQGGSRTAPTRKTLGRLIGAFKTVSTKQINLIRGTPGHALWQRNYWEHIIRDENQLFLIREYIVNNPKRWALDRENPLRQFIDPLDDDPIFGPASEAVSAEIK